MDNEPSPPDNTPRIIPPSFQNAAPTGMAPASQSAKPAKKRTKLWIVLASMLVAVAAISSFVVLSVIPKRISNMYITESKLIMAELGDIVDDLDKNNISQMKNTTSSYEEAKTVLAKHITDLKVTNDKTVELKDRYTKLKVAKSNRDLAAKNKKAFELAIHIQSKYADSLTMRNKIFMAFGTLPDELESFAANFYSGGKRVDFITQTNKIALQAEDAITKMKNFDPPNADDLALYQDRLDYLSDTQATFTKLNEYYRTSQDKKVDAEIAALTEKNIARKDKVTQITNNYLTTSVLANDLKAFKALSL